MLLSYTINLFFNSYVEELPSFLLSSIFTYCDQNIFRLRIFYEFRRFKGKRYPHPATKKTCLYKMSVCSCVWIIESVCRQCTIQKCMKLCIKLNQLFRACLAMANTFSLHLEIFRRKGRCNGDVCGISLTVPSKRI